MLSSMFLEITHLLQTIAVALSIFNLVAFLWLACTVWLNGNRHSLIARVGVVGLSLSAFFFFLHALLIFGSHRQAPGLLTSDFLWRLIWWPALGVPYIWFMIGLHYAALMNDNWHRRRPLLLLIGALLGGLVLVLLILNSTTFTFVGMLRLLVYSDLSGLFIDQVPGIFSPLIFLPFLFLCYVTFCAIGPWFTPNRVGRLLRALWSVALRHNRGVSLRRYISDVFWNDQANVPRLEEPVLSWHMARPGLLVAALLMVGLTISFGALGLRSMINWLRAPQYVPTTVHLPVTVDTIPLDLLLLDIFATGLVAVVVLLIGYSIVRHGILIERPLARRGFFEQWRGTVIVATTAAIFIAFLVDFTHSNLGALLVITAFATGSYALFTWSNYTAHDRYIALLRPFLSRTNLRHWLNTDLEKTEQSMEALFSHLCKDVLEVKCARLLVPSGPIRRSFSYQWPETEAQHATEAGVNLLEGEGTGVNAYRVSMLLQGTPAICWILPIYDELGLVAKLYLGPREDGGIFTDEDMHLAHACGQRILDTLRDHEAMLAVAGLLRRRIVDVKLLGAQQRRVLHDEILPQMHLALLHLESARPIVRDEHEEHKHMTNTRADQALNEAIEGISGAHRQLAAMMRATTTSAPHRLERDGMMHAIHTMITHDFQQAFDEVEWHVADEVICHIDEIVPPAIAELIFAAVQEALRNAARHARGTDVHRRLRITVKATCHPHLEIIVMDDGVGILSASSSTTGTGGGLLTHSALLAIAGGSLTVKSASDEGVTVRIFLPAESLR